MEFEEKPELKEVRMSEALDPLVTLHSDVFELIFQHFNNRDVLNSSMVSPLWFAATEASNKCAEQLRLKVVVPHGDDNWRNYFIAMHNAITSQRKYQNISLESVSGDAVQEIGKLLTGRHWKKCVMKMSTFAQRSEFECLMELIEEHVEDLEFDCVHFLSDDETAVRRKLMFPKLIMVNFRDSPRLVHVVLVNCRNLKILKQKSFRCSPHVFPQEILLANNQLEELELRQFGGRGIRYFEPKSTDQFLFKLKSLVLDKVMDESTGVFVKNQADSLLKLHLLKWPGIRVLELVLKMPCLVEFGLEIKNVENSIEWEFLQLNTSLTITELIIENCWGNGAQVAMFNVLFDSMPNLRSLTINDFNNELLTAIGPRCHKLEELDIRYSNRVFLGADNPLNFPNIKRLKFNGEIDEALRHRIGMKPSSRRTPFEQLLLDTVPGNCPNVFR